VTAVAIAAVKEGREARGGVFLNFVSEFVDGSRLSTNNAAYNFPMRRDPTGAFIQFPGITDARRLANLHRKLVARRATAVRARVPGEQPAKFFEDRVDAEMARQRELGTLRVGSDGDTYHLTVLGAATMVWRLLPPSAWVIRARTRLRAWLLLAALETSSSNDQPSNGR
jgi:hypothetical protein